jgi:hypothetical protein
VLQLAERLRREEPHPRVAVAEQLRERVGRGHVLAVAQHLRRLRADLRVGIPQQVGQQLHRVGVRLGDLAEAPNGVQPLDRVRRLQRGQL